MSAIGSRLGISATNSPPLFTQDKVTVGRRAAVNALYDELWNVQPPISSGWGRRSKFNALQYAAAHGWVPPFAWDDIDTDERPPTAAELGAAFVDSAVVVLGLEGFKPRMTPSERAEAVRVLHRERWGDRRIAQWLGVATETVLRTRQRLGLAGVDVETQAA